MAAIPGAVLQHSFQAALLPREEGPLPAYRRADNLLESRDTTLRVTSPPGDRGKVEMLRAG